MLRRRLVLHVGLPKTGSSALQAWCNKARESLSRRGVTYPKPSDKLIDPKHQFLVPALKLNDLCELRNCLAENDTETLILSTEGLTNHLYDFQSEALAAFREAVSHYDVFVYMVVRERNAWTKSYYKQAIINPPVAEYHYATPLSYAEFSKLPRVVRLTDHAALRSDVARAYGAHKVVVANYEEDWMKIFLDLLNIGAVQETFRLPEENRSVSDDLVEIIRQVNAMRLPPESRAGVLATIQACFQTSHNVLKSYRVVDVPGRSIFECLRARNAGQADMIAKLLEWKCERHQNYQSQQSIANEITELSKVKRQLVVVLGMHRSGTSAITRGLQALGVNLGEQLMPAVVNDNDKGFFEDTDVNNFNVELFSAIGGDWDGYPAFPASVLPEEKLEMFKPRAIELICSKIGERPFGLKDPRIAPLLPFWQSVFERANLGVSYVIAVRNPMSVAQSLARRNGFDAEKSYFLWLGHMLPAVLQTRGCRRVAVSYDLMISDPYVQLGRIAQAFDLTFDSHSAAVRGYVEEFLDAKLRHAEFDLNDLHGDCAAPADIIRAYEMFLRLARDEVQVDASEVEELFNQVDATMKQFRQLFDYISRFEAKIANRNKQIFERDRKIAEQDWELQLMVNSRSWKLTRPLRFLSQLVNRGT